MRVMTSIADHLSSALSSLQVQFSEDPEMLHLAVATVFSSIFWERTIRVIVVGGQAATWWLRVSGSRDVDFVTSDFERVRDILQMAGFEPTDAAFRLIHPGATATSSVLVELVGETIKVAGIQADTRAVSTIQPDDIGNPAVRRLMRGDALVIDPCLAFLNYADASSSASDWYDHTDEGSLAYERASALLELYRRYIMNGLRSLNAQGKLPAALRILLGQRFGIRMNGQ